MESKEAVRAGSGLVGVPRRFGGRTIRVLVLLALGIVLIGAATALPWWQMTFVLGAQEAYLGWGHSGVPGSFTGNQALVYGLTDTLVLAALALSVAALVLFVSSMLWPRAAVWCRRLGTLASVCILAAPVFLFVALPGAMVSDWPWGSPTSFFGSNPQSAGGGATWGAGIGWYIAFGAFVLCLASARLGYAASRDFFAQGGQPIELPSRAAEKPAPGAKAVRGHDRRATLALVLLVLTVVLTAAACFLPWWSITSRNYGSAILSYYLVGSVLEGSGLIPYYTGPIPPFSVGLQVGILFTVTLVLLLISLGQAIVEVVRFGRSGFRPQGLIRSLRLGILGSFLLLVAALTPLEVLPGVVAVAYWLNLNIAGFFGSAQYYVWGGDVGWYLALVAFATGLVGTILAFSTSLRFGMAAGGEPAAAETPEKAP